MLRFKSETLHLSNNSMMLETPDLKTLGVVEVRVKGAHEGLGYRGIGGLLT